MNIYELFWTFYYAKEVYLEVKDAYDITFIKYV